MTRWVRTPLSGIALSLLVLVLAVTGAGASTVSDALIARGQKALAMRDYAAARRAFEQAIVADPRNVRAYTDLGFVNQQTGAVDKAWKYYQTALELEPNDVGALSRSGHLDLAIGRLETAEQKLAKLRRLCATCPEFHQLNHAVTAQKARQQVRR